MKVAIAMLFSIGALALTSWQERPPASDGVASSIGLEIGQPAPAFALADQFGHAQSNETVKGSKGMVPEESNPHRQSIRAPTSSTHARLLRSAKTVSIARELQYQACDATIYYPPASVPVKWDLKVEPLDLHRSPENIRHTEAKERP
jgi:hypothetical protein